MRTAVRGTCQVKTTEARVKTESQPSKILHLDFQGEHWLELLNVVISFEDHFAFHEQLRLSLLLYADGVFLTRS